MQAKSQLCGWEYKFTSTTQQILLTTPVRSISAVIDWQGVSLLLWGPCGPVWFIGERMDGSVNITELQLQPSALRQRLDAMKLTLNSFPPKHTEYTLRNKGAN